MGTQYQGMRGAKLARHSHFMRMHSRKRKVFACTTPPDVDQPQLIFL